VYFTRIDFLNLGVYCKAHLAGAISAPYAGHMKLAKGLIALGLLALSGPGSASANSIVDLQDTTYGSAALFINNEGDVAGQYYTNSLKSKFVAFFYSGITQTSSVIGPFTNGGNTQATGLNASGDVSGIGFTNSNNTGPNAFIYSGGSLTDLDSASNSDAYGLNDSGTVVGSVTSGGNTHALVVTQASSNTWNTPVDLGTTGGSYSEADFINNAGAIAGNTNTLAYYSATATALSSSNAIGLTGATSSTATAMNAAGQVVGESNLTGTSNQQAFLYAPGTTPITTDLGTLIPIDGGTSFIGSSEAEAINSSGEVVGESDVTGSGSPGTDSGNHDAFLYANSTMTDLGLLAGYTNSVANSINDVGIVVGTDTNSTTSEAFIYMNNSLIDLSTLLPDTTVFTRLLTATGINDNNGVYQVIGQGLTTSGTKDGYILSLSDSSTNPTPEPSTIFLMALGLLFCAAGFRQQAEACRLRHLALVAVSRLVR
jgi:probable HAF family extracellular repeat protein